MSNPRAKLFFITVLLGKDAVNFVRTGLATLQSEIESWESASTATDFDS